MRGFIIGSVIVLIAAGAAWFVWPRDDAAPPAGRAETPVVVIVTEVRSQAISDVIEALGTARARESVELTSIVADKVIEIGFQDGAAVERGAVMVRLDAAAEKADLSAAAARLDEKQRNRDRVRQLVRDRVVSQAELDRAQAELRTAQAQVEVIQAAINDRVIRAPFSGRAGLREVSVGTLIRPGDRITTLHDIEFIDVDFTVPEVELERIKPQQAVKVRAAAFPDMSFTGVVHAVATQVDPVSRSMTVRARVPNADFRLLPGMLVNVELLSNPRTALVVPESALILRAQQAVVYVDNAGRAERREIRSGNRRGGLVEVISGLAAGERVVMHGADKLSPDRSLIVRGVFDGSAPIAELLKKREAGS